MRILMMRKRRWLLIQLLMIAVIIVGLQVFPSSAEEPVYGITEGVPDDIAISTDTNNPTRIGFGEKKWDAIGYQGDGVYSEDNTVTLLLANDYNFTAGIIRFSDNKNNAYGTSLLKKEMEDAYNSLQDEEEKKLIEQRILEGGSENYNSGIGYNSDKIAGDSVTGTKFWPLSVEEAGELNQEVRKFVAEGKNGKSSWWWLRSPGDNDINAASVTITGGIRRGGDNVNNSTLGIRPAFRLNLESIIFTSAAADGKSANVESHLSDTKMPAAADALKFTIRDDKNQKLSVAGVTKVSNGTNELQFHYSKATNGTNQYISCVLVKGEGDSSTVEYYGKLEEKKGGSNTSGTVTIPLDGVAEGDYTLKIFSEQDNGENNTDYAGSIHEYQLKVESEKGTIGGELGSDNGLRVYYGHNGMENWDEIKADTSESPIAWRVMEKNDEGTILTLMSDKLLGNRVYNVPANNEKWSGSDIAQYLNGKFMSSSFDYRESGAMRAYGDTEKTKYKEEININQKIVLPSYAEIIDDNGWFNGSDDRIAYYEENIWIDKNYEGGNSSTWWLRSPGTNFFGAANISEYGIFDVAGSRTTEKFGVRPSFRLNLESVILTSAAVGDKSENVGRYFVHTTVPIGDIKLTLLDEKVEAPVITMESKEEAEVLSFQYSGSMPKGYQYISCILVEENGEEALYYGKLAEPELDQDQGEFELALFNIQEGTYTLKIFWEECHGDYETDYASQPVECTLEVSSNGEGGVVEDLVPPVVKEIEPEHEVEEVPVSGEIKITFNEDMDTAQKGNVTLIADQQPISLSGGTWSDNKQTYTVTYVDLAYGTDYTIEVSGFRDVATNVMKPDSTSAFTTENAALEPTIIKNLDDNITFKVGETATLEVEADDPPAGGGTLSYQWYSNTVKEEEAGEEIQGADQDSYDLSTDKSGVLYYYVVVTNTKENKNGDDETKASITSNIIEVKIQEKTPQAGIDYEKEELIGLESGSYLVGTDNEEITVNGTTYPIDAAWMTGNTLSIIRKSIVDRCNSGAQSLVIPKRPDAPKVDGVNTSAKGSADGKITGTSTAMEYSADNGKSWKPCKGTTVEGMSAGDYLVRVKADNETKAFYGDFTKITIGEGAAIPDSSLSIESITFDTITEGAALPAAKNIVISNQGGQDVQLKEVTVSGSAFMILSSDQKTVLAGGSNTAWQIQLAEKLSAGVYQETITVMDSNQKTFTATVSIRVNQIMEMEGNAVVGTSFKVTPSTYDSTGIWNYDNNLLSAESGEGYAVFTPILDGETEIIYQSGSGVTGSLKLTIQKGKLTGIAAEGWSDKYDGEPHTITLTGVPEGASVEYSIDHGASWQQQNPSYTEQGTEVTVQYRVTKAGYDMVTGSAVIKIEDCDHQWSDWKEIRAASCESNGEQQRECQICNGIQTKEIPSSGHSWGEEQIELATCENNGYTYRVCKSCGKVQYTGVLMKLPHEYGEWEVTEKAGCETPGSQKHTCKNCGTSETEQIPPTGHDLGDWYIAKAPTEKETGLQQRDCKNCDYQETEIIEKLGALVITGLPKDNKIAVGDRFTLVPSDDSRKGSDGWKWNPGYFDATFNSPATFTARKAGKTEISYTAVDGRVMTLSISIEEELGETKETETESEKETETEAEKETNKTAGKKKSDNNKRENKKSAVKTGDFGLEVFWLMILMILSGFVGIVVYQKNRNS